jgi:hypothetical protein
LYANYVHREQIASDYNFDPCWAQEFLNGFPTVFKTYEIANKQVGKDFVSATEPAYKWALENTNHGSGMVADLCNAVNYLLIVSHPEKNLI